jgi:AcrR family transcriptional regulator
MSVDHVKADVKRKRGYDASGRRERAEQARTALLDAALARFLAEGYAATTVNAIAHDAGVSAATIFKTFGGKPGLVRALVQRALEGAGPVPAEQRSDALQRDVSDPRALIDAWGRLTAEVSPRGSPILLLLKESAATDPAAVQLLAELDEQRLRRMGRNARTLADGGHLRPDVRWRDARDLLWLHTAPELYDLLVCQRGWSVRRYADYIGSSLKAALLDRP